MKRAPPPAGREPSAPNAVRWNPAGGCVRLRWSVANFSRFDKLENARKAASEQPRRTEPALERFAEADPRHTTHSPVATDDGTLQRFATDTEDVVRTAEAGLATLPTLECGACGTDCGKFDVACHVCGSRLDTDQTLARNEPRVHQRALDHRTAGELTQRTLADELAHRRSTTLPLREAPFPWVALTLGTVGVMALLWALHPALSLMGLAFGIVAGILSRRSRRR